MDTGFTFMQEMGTSRPIYTLKREGDGVAKIWLKPELKHQYFDDFKAQEKKEIMKLASENYELLKSKWDEFFS